MLDAGATETDFFERAEMMDKGWPGQEGRPAMVAEVGFKAMMNGEGDVVAGWHNKLQARDRAYRASGLAGRGTSEDSRTPALMAVAGRVQSGALTLPTI